MIRSLLRTKPLPEVMAETVQEGHRLRKKLGPWDLTALGIGCIIGVGIFVLPGVQAAKNAGPGIVLSFAIAAGACACAALCYAELAAMIPVAGSAYLVNFLRITGVNVPQSLVASPWDHDPGLFNLPAVLIVVVLTTLLVRGITESSRVNLAIVIFKLAAIVFLAFVGFDAVSTAAEEAVNPQRDMPIGIVGSLVVATVLYMVVAAIMTGIVLYQELGVADPIALVLNRLAMPWGSVVVSIGAMAGITSVLLVLLLGQPRILFAMSRDGLLPPFLAKVHPCFGTLFAFIIVCAGVLVLRYTRRELPRPFRTPLFPVLPAAGILACALLMVNLPWTAWERFIVWLVLGLLLYFLYGRRRSRPSATV